MDTPEQSGFHIQDILSGLNTPTATPLAPAFSFDTDDELRSSAEPEDRLSSETPQRSSSEASHPVTRPHGEHQATNVLSTVSSNFEDAETITASTSLEIPMRSIFSSPQPTSSLSVNTARASMSTANSSRESRPFGMLSAAGPSRRILIRPAESLTTQSLATADYPARSTEKDADDPTSNTLLSSGLHLPQTPQLVSTLFAPPASENDDSPQRHHKQHRRLSSRQNSLTDTNGLGRHLYHIGFKEGRHSDITIYAFGEEYRLHKLLLDRVPYFSTAFSGPWAESSAKEMTLEPSDIDHNITKRAFELAIKRLYGSVNSRDEEEEAIGLFATACWLDMPDVVEKCIENILGQMSLQTLHVYIRLVTQNCYGKAGDRILASAKAMLCRDGWEMPYHYWDSIPSGIIRDIISGDPFYIPGEWERWFLALRLLNRRLRQCALAEELITSDGHYIRSKPRDMGSCAIRPHNKIAKTSRMSKHHRDPWKSLYARTEIAPLLELLDTGIYYVHLRFEQLQQLRSQKDIFGVPILPENVISDALWMSMELRQKIVNAPEGDLELDLTAFAESPELGNKPAPSQRLSDAKKGKQPEGSVDGWTSEEDDEDEIIPPSVHRPRRFWVPTTDVSCISGGLTDTTMTASLGTSMDATQRSQSMSAGFEPSDVAWPPDLGGSIFDSHGPLSRNLPSYTLPRYSHYPPFRFCAEFPNPRILKEEKRVYSQTVWYAGSLWNLYIVRGNASKTQQLGIYLHRPKDKDPTSESLPLTVDDRIGQLEREMLLRQKERRHRYLRAEQLLLSADRDQSEEVNAIRNAAPDSSLAITRPSQFSPKAESSRQDHNLNIGPSSSITTTSSNNLHHDLDADTSTGTKSSTNFGSSPSSSMKSKPAPIPMTDDDSENDLAVLQTLSKRVVSTIPPYTDARPTINTYYKIYCPSKGGRLLSVYESTPDSFDLGKSWGWRSCQMVLDDGISVGDATQNKEGKLRYMVVLGNV